MGVAFGIDVLHTSTVRVQHSLYTESLQLATRGARPIEGIQRPAASGQLFTTWPTQCQSSYINFPSSIADDCQRYSMMLICYMPVIIIQCVLCYLI